MLFNKKILNNQQWNLNFISIILTLLIIINQKVNPSINQIFQRMEMYIFFFYIVFIPNVFESFNKEQGRILKALFFISISILYLKTFLLKLPEYKFNLNFNHFKKEGKMKGIYLNFISEKEIGVYMYGT